MCKFCLMFIILIILRQFEAINFQLRAYFYNDILLKDLKKQEKEILK